MLLTTIAAPAPALALDDVKKHLRVDHSDDDDLIAACMAAAQGQIDGPDGWLGRAVGLQTLELALPAFPQVCDVSIVLPLPPLVAVVAVGYLDTLGVLQTIDPALYETRSPAVLRPLFNTAWPWARCQDDAVRIRYQAGYAPATNDVATVPWPIRAALLLMTADLYGTRDAKIAASLVDNPTIERLLVPFRVWSA